MDGAGDDEFAPLTGDEDLEFGARPTENEMTGVLEQFFFTSYVHARLRKIFIDHMN
ncbi:hypothetical protein KEJ49_03035 [Candidatus Bathyarchaeota archaeon]|nr:hypothetical protein [Candidatus Bathyarchaeota archaeon]